MLDPTVPASTTSIAGRPLSAELTRPHQPATPSKQWLTLDHRDDGNTRMEITGPGVRADDGMFGGFAIASAVACFEHETGRRSQWVTVQFIQPAAADQHLDCHVEELARGRSAIQCRMIAMREDDIVFVALGVTSRARPDAPTCRLDWMPDVNPPDLSTPVKSPLPPELLAADGPHRACELRRASARRSDLVWIRLRDYPLDRPALAYLADLGPHRALHATGIESFVTSIDNSIRFAAEPTPDQPWALLDPHVDAIDNGYAHLTTRIWAPTGDVLAVASQTMSLRPRPRARQPNRRAGDASVQLDLTDANRDRPSRPALHDPPTRSFPPLETLHGSR